MTDRPTTELDPFESALLTELKAILPPAAAAEAAPARSWVAPRRWQLTVAGVAAAALAVALLVPGLGPTPAYAVTGGNNGEVRVKVNRLEGAEGLERALAEHGIPADITYLPEGKECAAGRYTEVHTPGLTLGVAATKFYVTIPPGAVGKDDTFVLDASVVPRPNGVQARVSFGFGNGPIKPCHIVAST
ncbi:hypothetical protein SAMN04488543_1598 [Friedmanniella luteola]|uniref:Uncharacterized protein n=1 Tax=Friedmanniella luteola TaxID=546871 RepID=A0A1H1RN11_9ACTN|nr:hypothetical protein [Friedmanniella luteola]SDS36926.1 hypothetical protein SAMN04488543_1598 [Friedmanniella luteola]